MNSAYSEMEFREYYYKKSPTGYYISEYGDVYSTKSNKFLKPCVNTSGRLSVAITIDGKTIALTVYRMVAETYIGEIPPNMTVNHKDEDVMNNHYSNLEIVTRPENTLMYLKNHGGISKKYDDDFIHDICKMLSSGIYYRDIAQTFDIHIYFMYKLSHGEMRKDIVKEYLPFPESATRRIASRKQLSSQIEELLDKGFSNEEIIDELKLEKSDALTKLIYRCRKKLSIHNPHFFTQEFIDKVESLVLNGKSNEQIREELGCGNDKRIGYLFSRIRTRTGIRDFNANGVSADIQRKMLDMMRDGKSNPTILETFDLERNKYTINLLARLRKIVKKEKFND